MSSSKPSQKIKASDPRFESAHIVVVSHNGVVLLAGEVEQRSLKLESRRGRRTR